MAKDYKITDYGDLYVDPDTHDFVIIDGVEEVTQRIKATLEIFYQEMSIIDPEQGMDYTYFLGKRFSKEQAETRLRDTIMAKVPEVDSVDEIKFKVEPATRSLSVYFRAKVTPTESTQSQIAEGGVNIGI